MSVLGRRLMLGLATLALPAGSFANTIVSITNPGSTILDLLNYQQILDVSWTQTSAYANVSITTEMEGTGSGSLTAYLTTKADPTETLTDQIATFTFTPSVAIQTESLFSGLNLDAGTYFLVLAPTTADQNEVQGYWAGDANFESNWPPPLTTDAGVTYNGTDWANNTNGLANLTPANTFTPLNGEELYFNVTGDLAAPEPASAVLMLAGALGCLLARKRGVRA